jgi:hypothetical protein
LHGFENMLRRQQTWGGTNDPPTYHEPFLRFVLRAYFQRAL